MAFTTADLDAIDLAIASSELEVDFNGRKVKFDSFRQLRARRQFIKQQIDLDAGNCGRIRQVRVNVRKGI